MRGCNKEIQEELTIKKQQIYGGSMQKQKEITTQKQKTFLEALTSNGSKTNNSSDRVNEAVPLSPSMMPRMEGGNVVVQVDESEYQEAVKNLQFSVIGRYTLQNKDVAVTTMEIHIKLASFWQISDFKLIALGRGCYHVILRSMSDQSIAMSKEPIKLKPRIFRVSRWLPGFNPSSQVLSTTQVWIRIKELPIEYRTPQSLFNIASGVGFLLEIDPLTMSLGHGLYASVLVDVDLAKPIPDRILVTRATAGTSFFVWIECEKLPKFCSLCGFLGHTTEGCRRKEADKLNSAPDRFQFGTAERPQHSPAHGRDDRKSLGEVNHSEHPQVGRNQQEKLNTQQPKGYEAEYQSVVREDCSAARED